MKKSIIIGSFFIFMSCGNTAIKKPNNLISEDQMVDILYDVMIINSAKGVNKQLLENNIQNPKEYIYTKYKIDSLQFAESNNYYTNKREAYKSIYDRLDLKLKAKKTAYETIIENQKRIKDSIKKSIEESSDSLRRDRKLKLESKLKRPLKKFDTLLKRPLK